jgi:hypothetical protein
MAARSRGLSPSFPRICFMLTGPIILGAWLLGFVAAVQEPPKYQIPILPPHVPTGAKDSLTSDHKFVSATIYARFQA